MSTVSTELQSAITLLRNMTDEDLRYLNQTIVAQLKYKKKVVARQFSDGDRVTFFARGVVHNGRIVSTGQMNHKVITDGGVRWTVAATLLKHIPA